MLCAWLLGSCLPSVDIPETPDMESLVEEYNNPDGRVIAEVLSRTSDRIEERAVQVQRLGLQEELGVIMDLLRESLATDQDDPTTLIVNGTEISTPSGFIEVTRTCAGWDRDAAGRDPDENGTLAVSILLGGGEIQPVIVGEMDRCRTLTVVDEEEFVIELDLDISLHVGESYAVGLNPTRDLTFAYTGAATINDTTMPVENNFRINTGGMIELNVEINTEGENFVYFLEPDGQLQGIRDETGEWGCSLTERTCQSPQGSFSW